MNKIFLILLSIVILSSLVNATQILMNDDIVIHSFREKVDVYKEIIDGKELVRVKITDVFSFSVPQKLKNEKIFFSLKPPYHDFFAKSENISDVRLISCEAGNHKINYSLDETFGLSCPVGEFEDIIHKQVNGVNIIEFDASNLNWFDFLGKDKSKTVYISINYIMDNLILETENYNTLWIKKIDCNYHSPNCLDKQTAIYVSIPTYLFVNGGYNHKILGIDKENQKMVFISEDYNEDVVLTYEDTKRERLDKIKWFILATIFSFFFSIIATKFGELSETPLAIFIILLIFMLIVISSIVVGFSLKIPLIIYSIVLIGWLLNKVWYYFVEGNGLMKAKEIIKKYELHKRNIYNINNFN